MTNRNGISIDKTDPPSRVAVAVKWVRLAAAVVIVALLVAFIVDNSEHVRVGFVFGQARVRLIWVLLITGALGALADRLVPRLRARRAHGDRSGGPDGPSSSR